MRAIRRPWPAPVTCRSTISAALHSAGWSSGRIDMGAVEAGAVSADFDVDLDVDGSDFLAWQRGLGASGAAAMRTNGNADGDGDVDGDDLAVWKSQFGLRSPRRPGRRPFRGAGRTKRGDAGRIFCRRRLYAAFCRARGREPPKTAAAAASGLGSLPGDELTWILILGRSTSGLRRGLVRAARRRRAPMATAMPDGMTCGPRRSYDVSRRSIAALLLRFRLLFAVAIGCAANRQRGLRKCLGSRTTIRPASSGCRRCWRRRRSWCCWARWACWTGRRRRRRRRGW